jgi:hypothetical protein
MHLRVRNSRRNPRASRCADASPSFFIAIALAESGGRAHYIPPRRGRVGDGFVTVFGAGPPSFLRMVCS